MAFTAAELANIANATIDFHIKGPAFSQVIQARPLYDSLKKNQKFFPGGKEYITEQVKGVYSTSVEGYDTDDTVTYVNPANIEQAEYKWYEIHAGIQVTMTELKKSGISVVDEDGKNVSRATDAEMVALTDLLEDKLEDLSEGWARSFTDMLWRDGSQDAKAIPGIQALLSGTPSTGVVGGIDRAANSWWRNRASLAVDSSTPSNLNLINTLRPEMRQLKRYATNAKHMALCGSDFLDALDAEFLSKGYYTQTGFTKSCNKNDFGMDEIFYKGMGFMYDPALDDLSLSKYCFIIDENAIRLRTMTGEDMKMHSPARPADQYVIFRGITYTGALTSRQMNSNGVYSIA